jgi:ferredoxin-NADP reductase
MTKHIVTLVKKERIANGTMAFHFTKPDDFDFVAGQYCTLTLIDPAVTDDEGDMRTISFAAAPFENTLLVATRVRDTAFKQVLKDLPVGAEAEMNGPYGAFALEDTDIPAVFIIGGIGITPARGIILQALHDKPLCDVTLLFVNHRRDDAPFTREFEVLATEYLHFTFVPISTQPEADDTDQEQGHLTTDILGKYVPDLAAPVFYLAGPSGMVTASRTLLETIGIEADHIQTEEFPGY